MRRSSAACFNPRAPCGARRDADFFLMFFNRFNPRAPCGARPDARDKEHAAKVFQSTRPMRGATMEWQYGVRKGAFQSTRPMRGATLPSMHSTSFVEFQSTRPMRGATRRRCAASPKGGVSIHAPHAGRDLFHAHTHLQSYCFNPRAPCGARPPAHRCRASSASCFNPRAPCGARPFFRSFMTRLRSFNPRAPCGARRHTSPCD